MVSYCNFQNFVNVVNKIKVLTFSINLYLLRYSIFTGMIDSRELQAKRGSSSQSSDGSSRGHRTNQEVELERLREELWRRDEYTKQQEEYLKRQQEYYTSYTMQQQQVIQVSVNG